MNTHYFHFVSFDSLGNQMKLPHESNDRWEYTEQISRYKEKASCHLQSAWFSSLQLNTDFLWVNNDLKVTHSYPTVTQKPFAFSCWLAFLSGGLTKNLVDSYVSQMARLVVRDLLLFYISREICPWGPWMLQTHPYHLRLRAIEFTKPAGEIYCGVHRAQCILASSIRNTGRKNWCK